MTTKHCRHDDKTLSNRQTLYFRLNLTTVTKTKLKFGNILVDLTKIKNKIKLTTKETHILQ